MAARRSPAEWQRLITVQAASQLPTREFCRAQGIALSSFHYWKRRLCGAHRKRRGPGVDRSQNRYIAGCGAIPEVYSSSLKNA
jgi:hypothetical protein